MNPHSAWKPTAFQGVWTFDAMKGGDERGTGLRVLDAAGLAHVGVQFAAAETILLTNKPGVLRGMHYQVAPHEQSKVVCCIQGSIWDVLLDMRPDSPTHGQSLGIELSATNNRLLHIPVGIAHGFCVQGPSEAHVLIQVSQPHVASASRGILWDSFGHAWPLAAPVISVKDLSWPHHH